LGQKRRDCSKGSLFRPSLGKEDGFKLGKEDGFKLGKEDGFKLGNVSMLVSLVKDAVISISEAAKRLNISEADFQKLMEAPQQ